MASERLYYDDSYTTRFAGRVASAESFQGRPAVELEATYFYPESGGQEADRGRIGGARVVDVQAADDGRVWHVLGEHPSDDAASAEQLRALGDVEAEVDWTRRFDHMQQHTGQHILSAALERELNAATISSHLGEERSTIEADVRDLDWKTIDRIESTTNAIVWADRPIVRHWVDDEGVKRFALRKPPKFTGRIRIVEIPDWDVSACGGTHTLRTGEVGVVKIVRWERVRNNVRLEFLCGRRALRDYAWRTSTLLDAARRRTIHDTQLIEHLERAASERDELKKRVRELSEMVIGAEAAERVAQSPAGVAEFRDVWPREDVRTFAFKCLEAGARWVAAAAGAPEPCLVLARAKSATGDLRAALLPGVLERSRGKGGGSPDFLQVAAGDATVARAAWEWGKSEMPAVVPSVDSKREA
jgi:alanyl-tRNA synthetase